MGHFEMNVQINDRNDEAKTYSVDRRFILLSDVEMDAFSVDFTDHITVGNWINIFESQFPAEERGEGAILFELKYWSEN